MREKRLKNALKDKSRFVVIVELTGGPNFSFAPIDKFLSAYKAAGRSSVVDGFDVVGITSTDNSGGTPNRFVRRPRNPMVRQSIPFFRRSTPC